jgi:predicted RNA binding protein YcfA (HicA-like mRNA interferase family)
MPKKLRELKAMLLQAGFSFRAGKGSHTVWKHPKLAIRITLSGKDGDDARPYQERDVADAVRLAKEQEQ